MRCTAAEDCDGRRDLGAWRADGAGDSGTWDDSGTCSDGGGWRQWDDWDGANSDGGRLWAGGVGDGNGFVSLTRGVWPASWALVDLEVFGGGRRALELGLGAGVWAV
jgi:hypothetical protein